MNSPEGNTKNENKNQSKRTKKDSYMILCSDIVKQSFICKIWTIIRTFLQNMFMKTIFRYDWLYDWFSDNWFYTEIYTILKNILNTCNAS